LAAIQDVQPYEDGRMDLVTVGVSRFRILDELPGEPYAQARVELLDEPDEPTEIHEVVELFESYLETLSELSNQSYELKIVRDPEQLSYQIASVLPLELEEKQLLLEAPSTCDRLSVEADMLRRETEQIREFAAKSRELGYFYFRGKRLSRN
ncbi:MAG TPA: LON peptidase substrate-binding domain-containing protein, partial [Stenomitos sp.]